MEASFDEDRLRAEGHLPSVLNEADWLTGIRRYLAFVALSNLARPGFGKWSESMKNRPFSQLLLFALAGLREGWRRERSFRTQVFLGAFAVVVVAILGAAPIWRAVVALAIALVLAAELLNSGIRDLGGSLAPGDPSRDTRREGQGGGERSSR